MRPLVVVARAPTRCGERADRGVHAVDLDTGRPVRAAIRGLAEVDGAVAAAEPRPRDIDVVPLRARGVRVGDHELFVVKDRRIIVVRDDPDRDVSVRLERLDARLGVEGGPEAGAPFGYPDSVGFGGVE